MEALSSFVQRQVQLTLSGLGSRILNLIQLAWVRMTSKKEQGLHPM